MRNINACRLWGIFFFILFLASSVLFYYEITTEDSIHIALFFGMPLFLAMGIGMTFFPLSDIKVSDIIGEKSLLEIFKPKNIGLLIKFEGVPLWKQLIYGVLLIMAIIAIILLFVFVTIG